MPKSMSFQNSNKKSEKKDMKKGIDTKNDCS